MQNQRRIMINTEKEKIELLSYLTKLYKHHMIKDFLCRLVEYSGSW